MKTLNFRLSPRRILAASLVVALAVVPAMSEAYGRGGGHWHGGGYRGGGWGWGPAFGLALGVDLALSSPYYYGGYPYDYYPRTVVVAPPPVVYQPSTTTSAAVAPSSSMPEPIFYPRTGQSAAQTENDVRECNSWATTQPRAVADGSVFHRAVAACMDGRGYTVR